MHPKDEEEGMMARLWLLTQTVHTTASPLDSQKEYGIHDPERGLSMHLLEAFRNWEWLGEACQCPSFSRATTTSLQWTSSPWSGQLY